MKKVKISFDDLMKAYGVYRHVSKSPTNKNTSYHFTTFLAGEGYYIHEGDIFEDIYKHGEATEEVVQKIKWLNGPNARALYKAWCVKHGNK